MRPRFPEDGTFSVIDYPDSLWDVYGWSPEVECDHPPKMEYLAKLHIQPHQKHYSWMRNLLDKLEKRSNAGRFAMLKSLSDLPLITLWLKQCSVCGGKYVSLAAAYFSPPPTDWRVEEGRYFHSASTYCKSLGGQV